MTRSNVVKNYLRWFELKRYKKLIYDEKGSTARRLPWFKAFRPRQASPDLTLPAPVFAQDATGANSQHGLETATSYATVAQFSDPFDPGPPRRSERG